MSLPPPPPNFTYKAPSTTTPVASGGIGSLLGQTKLRQTNTSVRQLESKVINVLLITKNWTCYNWLSNDIKKVLLTNKEANEERIKYGSERAQSAFTHVEIVDDYQSGILEWKALQLHKKYRFTHVIVLSENDLIRGARIRKLLGITTGQSVENAFRYRDKALMKSIVSSKGLSVPTFATVESASDVIQFTQLHGYPVVVKPKLGYSSINTTILRSPSDLIDFITNDFKSTVIDPIYGLMVEKFVNGPMYHIDGFVLDGKVVQSWPSKYVGTVVNFKKNRYIAGFGLQPNNPLVPRLNQYIEDVINALGSGSHPNPSHFPFHAEAWHTDDDDIVLCEIASRGAGGNIKKEIQEMFHINIDEIWTQAQCGDALPTSFEEDVEKFKTWRSFMPKTNYIVAWSYIYPLNGIVRSFPEKDSNGKIANLPDYCIHWQSFLEKDRKYYGPVDCADTVVACLVKGNDEQEVVKHLEEICDWFFANSVWE